MREYATQMDAAKKGIITPEMNAVAEKEYRTAEEIRELVAKGQNVTLDEVLCDMRKRDKNDSTRAAAPCVPAKDAVLFDNSDLDVDQTVEKALEIIYGKLGKTE